MRTMLGVCLVAGLGLSGCASQLIGTMTLGQASSLVGIVSTVATGKDINEHILSAVMDQDCRISEGLLRKDREICEPYGAPATRDDFQGLLIAGYDAEGRPVRAAPLYMRYDSNRYDTGDGIDRRLVMADIAAAQQRQYAEAEQRVAARKEQMRAALSIALRGPVTELSLVSGTMMTVSGPIVLIPGDRPALALPRMKPAHLSAVPLPRMKPRG